MIGPNLPEIGQIVRVKPANRKRGFTARITHRIPQTLSFVGRSKEMGDIRFSQKSVMKIF